jgi:hypothetical protein
MEIDEECVMRVTMMVMVMVHESCCTTAREGRAMRL